MVKFAVSNRVGNLLTWHRHECGHFLYLHRGTLASRRALQIENRHQLDDDSCRAGYVLRRHIRHCSCAGPKHRNSCCQELRSNHECRCHLFMVERNRVQQFCGYHIRRRCYFGASGLVTRYVRALYRLYILDISMFYCMEQNMASSCCAYTYFIDRNR